MTATRLPLPGQDDGVWGNLLNDFLGVSHDSGGALKDGVVTASKLSAPTGSTGQVLSYDSSASGKLAWQTVTASGAVADASSSTKGLVKLVNDLGGTADAPTVPGLAGKAALSHTHAITDVTGLQAAITAKADDSAVIHTTGTETVGGAKTFSTTIGGSVSGNAGTATALQTARTINGVSFNGTANITVADATKEPTITAGTTSQYYRGDKSWVTLDKSAVGLANVDNTADASKPISSLTQTALNGKEATVASGTTSQYYRGDKSWQTLDRTAVGLPNVDNTSDLNKPVSTATTTAINTALAGSTGIYILAPSDPDPTGSSPAGLYFRRTT